jgi:hypothetical protein
MTALAAMPTLAPPPRAYTAAEVLELPNNDSTAAFMRDLKEKGYCVIPNLVPKERCDQYVNDALEWLEGFGLGFKRDDKSTWHKDNLPVHAVGGLYNRYCKPRVCFVPALWARAGGSRRICVGYEGNATEWFGGSWPG